MGVKESSVDTIRRGPKKGMPGVGRPEMDFDPDVLLDLLETGATKKRMAEEMGMSIPTLRTKIAQLQQQSPVILEYRALQTLELTELQHKILSNITDDKIENAPLRDLVLAYKILKEKEFMVEGKPTEVKGLVHYLLEIEKVEQAEKQAMLKKVIEGHDNEDITDAEFEDALGDIAPESTIIAGIRMEDLPHV